MKSAIITGGTKGIGKAIAVKLLQEQYNVLLNYRADDEAAESTFNELSTEWPGKIFLSKKDLSQTSNVDSFFQSVTAIFSTVDVVVFNAGKTNRSSFIDLSLDDWNEVMDTNLTVPLFILKKLLPRLNPHASIVFVSSAMSIYPHSLSLPYGVSKSALNALVRNLVKFLSPASIRVNALLPGFVETDWQKRKSPEIRNDIEKKIAIARFLQPEEVAEACFFLVKSESMTGELLKLDGGYSFE